MRKLYPNLSKGRYPEHVKELAAARRSLYFWWWKYLRLSSDYWWLCQQKGKTTDKAFASVYADFGDVFADGFESWWNERGGDIFAYKLDPPRVSVIDKKALFSVGRMPPSKSFELNHLRDSDEISIVAIPLIYTKSEILSQLSELLKGHLPAPYPQEVSTDYEVGDLRGVRKVALIDSHRVWCLNDAVNREKDGGRLDRPERFTQQWLGRKLSILPKSDAQKFRSTRVEANERLAIRVKVNRYLSKANLIIKNVEIGNFPVFAPVPETKRWTKKQLVEKQAALISGAWTCPESSAEEVLALLK